MVYKLKPIYGKEECGVGQASPRVIIDKAISGDKDLHESSYLWNGNSEATHFSGYRIFRRYSQAEEPTLLTIYFLEVLCLPLTATGQTSANHPRRTGIELTKPPL